MFKRSLCAVAVGLSLSAAAFTWPAKPTAELKADCIRYARESGFAEFADRIERQPDLTTWIGDGIRFCEELLAKCEGADYDEPARRKALMLLDYPVHVNHYSRATPPEVVAAFRQAITDYIRRARERVLREVKAAKVPDGSLRAWHLYNMAYVLKGSRHTVLIDLTPNPFRDIWTEADWRAFAEVADMLVITHPHGDHTSFPLMRLLREMGKPLVLPCKMRDRATSDVFAATNGVHVLDRNHAEPLDVAGVKFWNFLGNQGKKIPCNVYVMEIDGVRVADNGDNSDCLQYAGLAKCPPADIIIASTWNTVTAFVGACVAVPGFDPAKAVFLPSHENELGHTVNHRESYREMYTDPKRLAAPGFRWPRVKPLAWGESLLFTR